MIIILLLIIKFILLSDQELDDIIIRDTLIKLKNNELELKSITYEEYIAITKHKNN
jgi:hypothetical protein